MAWGVVHTCERGCVPPNPWLPSPEGQPQPLPAAEGEREPRRSGGDRDGARNGQITGDLEHQQAEFSEGISKIKPKENGNVV